jgi:predicted transcriptional regulator
MRRRFDIIRNMLKAQGEVEYNKFIAMIQTNVGISRDKAKEYINTLKELGDVEVKNGFIRPILTMASETEVQKESKKIDEIYDAMGPKDPGT